MSQVMSSPVSAICEQQRRRSACASAPSDQHLCCSLPRLYNISSFYICNFMPLDSFWSRAGQFESYLVANPEDSFSRDVAHIWLGLWNLHLYLAVADKRCCCISYYLPLNDITPDNAAVALIPAGPGISRHQDGVGVARTGLSPIPWRYWWFQSSKMDWKNINYQYTEVHLQTL